MAKPLRLLYFAWLRERVGTSEEEVTPPEQVRTVGELVEWLRGRTPGFESAFSLGRIVRCAVNQEFATEDALVRPGDEVAFFPPVTGG